MPSTRKASGKKDATRIHYNNIPIKPRQVDYEAQAKWCGDNAYRRAKKLDLSEEEAIMLREVFGEPMPIELREE